MKPQSAATVRTEPARARQRKGGARRKLVPYVLAIMLLGAIVYGFLPKPIQVETAEVGPAPLVVSVIEEGKTRIRHRYTISPPIAGFLNRGELRAGASIGKGKTVLATLRRGVQTAAA